MQNVSERPAAEIKQAGKTGLPECYATDVLTDIQNCLVQLVVDLQRP